jgi:tRNA-2-methylthio-N6-dimethylallyladenosine synthase
VFSFKYSPRPGTKASRMDDDVARAVKEERLARLIALQDRINAEQMARYTGSVHEVLIDGMHPKKPLTFSGRTDGYRPVSLAGRQMAIGEMVQVRITGAQGHWLLGEETTATAATA